MKSPRFMLILFVLAFLAMQIMSFMSTLTKHEERVVKLEKQAVQFETKGTYIDLKMNPAVELKKEKDRFKAETVNFIIKVLVISGATAFVLVLTQRAQKGG
ncbi:MAG: hypothetical protein PHT62_02615 [Desulfotomaculaceae bacterium]|nr:hypothetical protein [Desulfotomaculaceae bacterium]